jgi:hypothetical protein
VTISTLSSELACVECGVNCSRPVSSYSCLQAKNKKHEKRTSETYFSNSRAALIQMKCHNCPLRASASLIALEAGGLRLSLNTAARFDSVRTPFRFRPSSVRHQPTPRLLHQLRLLATDCMQPVATGRALPCWRCGTAAAAAGAALLLALRHSCWRCGTAQLLLALRHSKSSHHTESTSSSKLHRT